MGLWTHRGPYLLRLKCEGSAEDVGPHDPPAVVAASSEAGVNVTTAKGWVAALEKVGDDPHSPDVALLIVRSA